DGVAGLACVHTEQDAGRGRRGFKGVSESEADGVDGGPVEGRLTGNATDAVGSKELLHELLISVTFLRFAIYLLSDTFAVSVPWATRARTISPGEVSAADLNKVPFSA